jgi:hypothetical protein
LVVDATGPAPGTTVRPLTVYVTVAKSPAASVPVNMWLPPATDVLRKNVQWNVPSEELFPVQAVWVPAFPLTQVTVTTWLPP